MHTRLKAEVIALARATPEVEICGLFYLRDGAHILPCRNMAADPTHDFAIDPQDYIRAHQLGPILGVYHSHPTSASFSEHDLAAAEHYALPLYLYSLPDGQWSEFIPSSYVRPLEGAAFQWGFSDCYGSLRAYCRQNCGVYLSDYDRDETFTDTGGHVIMERFEHEGFVRMSGIGEVRKDDALVFESRALPHHVGIFVGSSRFFHHPLNALSHIDPLDGGWLKRLKCVLRHKSRL